MPGRSRPVRHAGATASPSTTSCCGSKKNLVTKPCTALHSAEVEHGYADFRARREATVWQRLNRILLVLLVIAIWLVIVSLFVPPYKKLIRSRAEVDNLQQQVNEQQSLLARQTREVNLLKTDVTYLETIARDRLELMKESETSVRLEPARAVTSRAGASAPRQGGSASRLACGMAI